MMVEMATKALAKWGLKCKHSSAEMLVSPNVPVEDRRLSFMAPMVEGDIRMMTSEFKENLTVLSCSLDATALPENMLKHRLALAQRAFWEKISLWKSRAPRYMKLEAWMRYIHPIALHEHPI